MDSQIRKRFAATMAFERLDRPMIDYQAGRLAHARIMDAYRCSTEAELLDALGAEFFYLPGRDISQNEGYLPYLRGGSSSAAAAVEDTAERTCPLGIRWRRGAYDSKFSVDTVVASPLSGAENTADLAAHHWPSRQDFDFSAVGEIAESQRRRIRIGGLWTGILGDATRLIGFERFLTVVALNPDLVHGLIRRLTDMYLDLNDALFSQLRGHIDVWFFGNDFGSQNGLLMSPDMWYEFYFEPIKELCALARSHNLYVMMHSCGSIIEIIPWLIEAGVQILDPIQTGARNMQVERLVTQFGGKIVFHGGIDTQLVLPTGSVEVVEAHVRDLVAGLNARGGYIASTGHIFNEDTPIANVEAVYRVLNAAGRQ